MLACAVSWAAVVGPLTTGSAASGVLPTSPAQYKLALNAYCRQFTPRLHTLEKKMLAAYKARNSQVYYHDLGVSLGYSLVELRGIENADVPDSLGPQMAPVLHLVRRQEAAVAHFIAVASGKNVTAKSYNTAFAAAQAVTPALNRAFDGAGLKDCGSRQ